MSAVFLQSLHTGVPETVYDQDRVADQMIDWMGASPLRRLVKPLYRASGIRRRYSVVPDMGSSDPEALFRVDDAGRLMPPSTARRNAAYVPAARALGARIAGASLANHPGISPEEVTHVITASCTGFSNPGLDLFLVRDLGLRAEVERYHLGFMGCYAAFPALRLAAQCCRATPGAVVLVLCLECCTLHMQPGTTRDGVLGNALFADGAAAALVTARPPPPGQRAYRLGSFSSALETEGESDMAWTIGDGGFDLVLSSYVPDVLGASLRGHLAPFFERAACRPEAFARWAVHPGGRAIVDRVRDGLSLGPETVADSLAVLRDFGNMSSPTVMFVLARMLADEGLMDGSSVAALAFGPGLTIEAARLDVVGDAEPKAG